MQNFFQSRLNQRLQKLGEIGWNASTGMDATECSPANKAAREQVMAWMKEDGLRITVDLTGNIIGIWSEGCPEGEAPVIIGSHIDTVPAGGKYDGRYGVLAGLEVVTKLKERKTVLNRPVVVAAWTGEESAYFQPSMPGSRATVNREKTEEILDECKSIGGPCKDMTLREALTNIEALGEILPGFFLEGIDLTGVNYIELHIEQGKRLEREEKSFAVVSDIYGASQSTLIIKAKDDFSNVAEALVALTCAVNDRVYNDSIERGTVGSIVTTKTTSAAPKKGYEINFGGERDHAGGRPMPGRHDAAYAAASLAKRLGQSIVVENLTIPGGFINAVPDNAILTVTAPEFIETIAAWKADLETTAGLLAEERGVTFEIREATITQKVTEATLTTDKRHIKSAALKASEIALENNIKAVSVKYGVSINLIQGTREEPVQFDEGMITLLKKSAEKHPDIKLQGDGKVPIMQSGPFHDAMHFGRVMPSVMCFVPSINGISHHKDEFTHPKDLDIGVDVLTDAVHQLISGKTL